jgi:hypothetical protein
MSAKIYCGNNQLDRSLKANAGDRDFGTHASCFRKGYALGINQHIPNADVFLLKWSTGYKPHIIQRLYYDDNKAPPGYQIATLAQALQRGFAAGSKTRAIRERDLASVDYAPTRPLKRAVRSQSRSHSVVQKSQH